MTSTTGWAYPGEDLSNVIWLTPETHPETHPTHPETHPTHPETHPTHPETHPQCTLNAPEITDPQEIRVLFKLSDVLTVAGVVRQVWERSWLPALERVAPGGIKSGKGRYTREAVELATSLRAWRDDGKAIDDWVVDKQAQQSEQARMDAALSSAEANGAIVPAEVIELGVQASQSLALAESQASLAQSFAGAVLARIAEQQQAIAAQSALIDAQAIAAQAALQWARKRQIQAATYASLDAQAQALEQEAIAAQLQQFQGGTQP